MLASLVRPRPSELRAAAGVSPSWSPRACSPGVHFEGPWLAAARCGAQTPAQLRDPDPDELDKLLRPA